MTILWEFDEKHPKQVSAYGGKTPSDFFISDLSDLSRHGMMGALRIGSLPRLSGAGQIVHHFRSMILCVQD